MLTFKNELRSEFCSDVGEKEREEKGGEEGGRKDEEEEEEKEEKEEKEEVMKGKKKAEKREEEGGKELNLRFLRTSSDHLVLDLPFCLTRALVSALVSFDDTFLIRNRISKLDLEFYNTICFIRAADLRHAGLTGSAP